jgi:hypothetical protein
MTEQFILDYIPIRIKQLGYHNYHIRYRDLTIPAEFTTTIEAYTDLYFIVDDPLGLIVESDYGVYFPSTTLYDNIHQHKGEIQITNNDVESRRIKFIQVIIIN